LPDGYGPFADLMREPQSAEEAQKQALVLDIVEQDARRQLALAEAWAARAEVEARQGRSVAPRPTDGDTTPAIGALLKLPVPELERRKRAAEKERAAAEAELKAARSETPT
jgi:hypothetical protein